MTSSPFFALMAFILLSTLASCAHGDAERKLDDKLASEPAISNNAQLNTDVSHEIRSSDLTAEQKTKLLELKKKNSAECARLTEESRKLRNLLAQDLVQDKYDDREVSLIKKRLEDIEKQRLASTFAAISDANAILGRFRTQDQQFVSEMLEDRTGREL